MKTGPGPSLILCTIGFFAVGLCSFAACAFVLLVQPGRVFEPVSSGAVLALAHLAVLGWVTSTVVGAAYQIGPVLAGDPIWSRKLAIAHLLIHSVALGWMVWGFAKLDFVEVGHGGSLMVLGFILFALNLHCTASRSSRWSPAGVTYMAAQFWLLMTGAIAIVNLVNRYTPLSVPPGLDLLATHMRFGLIGFLLQALMGSALKLISMFLVCSARPGGWSWAGYALINVSLLALIPAQAGGSHALVAADAACAAGIACFGVDIVRLVRSQHKPTPAGVKILLAGLALLVPLGLFHFFGGIAMPDLGDDQRARVFVALFVFGPLTFSIFGAGLKIVPFLVWQLRYAPWAGLRRVPPTDRLVHSRWTAPLATGLALGWGYLAAGLLLRQEALVSVGAALTLIAGAWFAAGVGPAIAAFLVGTGPEDMPEFTEEITAGANRVASW